ncbi:SemiSWEET family sugar transporter [Nocardioides sp.]|uniref:SemiSWEET family sugar transporter n=1 Tax=Nocardioides sp. TaxID=35761 RepID=UPI0037843F43
MLAFVTTCWGLLMGLAPLLQVRVIVRDRDSGGTSLGWVVILLLGFMLWFAYGVVNHDVPIMITNVVSATVAATLLIVARIYGKGLTERACPGASHASESR